MGPIYLDHNAATPVLPEAAEAAVRAAVDAPGNPASAHAAGRKARRLLEDARERVAALLGAKASEVVFTGGATEANNLAVFGLAPPGGKHRIWAAAFEHDCVSGPVKALVAAGATVEEMRVDGRGIVLPPSPLEGEGRPEPQAMGGARGYFGEVQTTPHPVPTASGRPSPSRGEGVSLVCLMLANHETGAIQPVKAVAKALPPGVLLHTDAAQAVGKIPVNFRDLGAATLAASGHKFRGPIGVGLLLVKDGVTLKPLTYGGHQQRGVRPGTEPVPLAVGLAVALEHAVANMAANAEIGHRLRARLLAELRRHGCEFVVNGPRPGEPDGLPNTLNVSFPGARAELLMAALDLAGVACSTGAACSSGSLLPSPGLRAMGVPAAVLESAMRFSFAPTQTDEEAAEAANRVAKAVAGM